MTHLNKSHSRSTHALTSCKYALILAPLPENVAIDVAFLLRRFAFHAEIAPHNDYICGNNGPCRNDFAMAPRVT
jgi:hypothetical protein